MASSTKKYRRRLVESLKNNYLFLLALLFQVIIMGSLLIYHAIVRIYWVVGVHAALLLSIISLSMHLKNFSHKLKPPSPKRNMVASCSRRDKVIIVPTAERVTEAISVDESSAKNVSELSGAVIVRPPVYEFTRKNIRSKQLVYFTVETDMVNFKYCSTCKNWRPPTALHCSRCDCCTYNFDHHCMWLSNCVTRANYKAFIVYVVLVLVGSYFSVFSVLELFFISRDVKKLHFGILLGILALVAIFGAIFTTILIIFHIRLRIKRITTYEYIKIKHSPEITNNTQYFMEKHIKMV